MQRECKLCNELQPCTIGGIKVQKGTTRLRNFVARYFTDLVQCKDQTWLVFESCKLSSTSSFAFILFNSKTAEYRMGWSRHLQPAAQGHQQCQSNTGKHKRAVEIARGSSSEKTVLSHYHSQGERTCVDFVFHPDK